MSVQQIRAKAARARANLFKSFIADMPRPLRILDLGGTFAMWQRWGIVEADGLEIVLMNIHTYDTTNKGKTAFAPFISEQIGDVCALTTKDFQGFDVVFSNSMLEHLYTQEAQRNLARGVIESGKPYFIQVPNRYCLVDPHFPHPMAPFFAAWPRKMQAYALTKSKMGSGHLMANMEQAYERLSNYVPLSRTDLKNLFPQAKIITEWSLGLPMSLVAMRSKKDIG